MQTERLLNKRLLNKRSHSSALDKNRQLTGFRQSVPCEQPSLFADLFVDPSTPELASPAVSSAASSAISSAISSAGTVQQPGADSGDHLAAARMLAKKLRNRPRRTRGSKRTGIAICQHLIALLREGEQGSDDQQTQGHQTQGHQTPGQ